MFLTVVLLVCGFLPKRLLPKGLLPLDKRPKDFCPTDFCPKHKKVEIGRAAGTPITCVACCSLLFRILPLWEWKFWQIHNLQGSFTRVSPLRFEIFTKLHLFSNFLVTWDVILANLQGSPPLWFEIFTKVSFTFFPILKWGWFGIFTKLFFQFWDHRTSYTISILKSEVTWPM